MSRPPPGIEQSIRSTMSIPSHITTFDVRYMSTPPSSVNFGPQTTGGSTYTGGEYIPPVQGPNSGIYVPSPEINRQPNTSGIYASSERISPPARIEPIR